MRSFQNILHDASHSNFGKSKAASFLVWLIASSIFYDFKDYKKNHLLHHKYFGNLDKDPDMIHYEKINLHNLFKVNRFSSTFYTIYVFIAYYYHLQVKVIVTFFNVSFMTIFWITVILTSQYFEFAQELILYWIIPYLTTFTIINFIAEISEHGKIYDKDRKKEKENLIEFASKNTRNMILNFPLNYILFPNGDGYHALHHMFPIVPGFKLHEFHIILKNSDFYREIKFKHNTYSVVFANNKSFSFLNKVFTCLANFDFKLEALFL